MLAVLIIFFLMPPVFLTLLWGLYGARTVGARLLEWLRRG
jgi:hypothetical protein